MVRDRKIPPAPGPSQIVGFSGYRPLTNWEKKFKKVLAGIRQSLSFTLNFVYSSPAFSFSFSLSFPSFHVCRHIQRVHKFIAFFKISVVFLKAWPCNFPPKKRGLQLRVKLSVSFTLAYMEGRTSYVRTDGRN